MPRRVPPPQNYHATRALNPSRNPMNRVVETSVLISPEAIAELSNDTFSPVSFQSLHQSYYNEASARVALQEYRERITRERLEREEYQRRQEEERLRTLRQRYSAIGSDTINNYWRQFPITPLVQNPSFKPIPVDILPEEDHDPDPPLSSAMSLEDILRSLEEM